MLNYLSVITCELCGDEHAMRVPAGESVTSYLNSKPSFPIHWMAMIGGTGRKVVCEKCKQKNNALKDKQEAERKEFLKE